MVPSVAFVFWYWNQLQKDDRFTSSNSRPIEEWRLFAKLRRAFFGTEYVQEPWEHQKENQPK